MAIKVIEWINEKIWKFKYEYGVKRFEDHVVKPLKTKSNPKLKRETNSRHELSSKTKFIIISSHEIKDLKITSSIDKNLCQGS